MPEYEWDQHQTNKDSYVSFDHLISKEDFGWYDFMSLKETLRDSIIFCIGRYATPSSCFCEEIKQEDKHKDCCTILSSWIWKMHEKLLSLRDYWLREEVNPRNVPKHHHFINEVLQHFRGSNLDWRIQKIIRYGGGVNDFEQILQSLIQRCIENGYDTERWSYRTNGPPTLRIGSKSSEV